VGKGDTVLDAKGQLSVRLASGDFLPLTPCWSYRDQLDVPGLGAVTVKEIETSEELEGYERLTRLHYRGGGGAGRRVPLVAIVEAWELPRVVGFVELTSTFLVNTALARVLDTRFVDPSRRIAWSRWDTATIRKFGNSIARISRCVVFSELRGLGLSKILTRAAKSYAADRWHIGGLRPSFIEITADMLRYWPFVVACGFHYIGDTEGNRHRAVRDMRYLLSRRAKEAGMPQGGGGIMSAQRAYAETVAAVMAARGVGIEKIISILHRSPEKLSDEEWVQLHKVYRAPKPTYMAGLTPSAVELLKRRVVNHPESAAAPARRVIEIKGFSLAANSAPRATAEVRRVQEAFGIVTKRFEADLVPLCDLTIASGESILIGGPSGSGKSLLLMALRRLLARSRERGRLPTGIVASGAASIVGLRVAVPTQASGGRSPIEILGHLSLEAALRVLASAGIAEPQVYVRPARTLSLGQKYRLSIAVALASSPDVLLIDEFCEPLDRFTTIAVCQRLQRVAARTGLSIVAATADPARVVDALKPQQLWLLSSDGRIEVRRLS
jgi:ABC-type ATPase with predicted acetyltransferase domain